MAYDFVSASSHNINYGDVTFLDGETSISGHGWINLDNVTQDNYIFAKHVSGSSILFLNDDVGGVSGRTDTFTIAVDGSSGGLTRIEGATNAASTGVWISVGFSWLVNDASGLRLYINGVEDANSPVTTHSGAFSNAATDLRIGNAGSAYADAQIDDCALWTSILTTADFASLAVGASAAMVQPQNLVWNPDLIGNANDPISGISPTITGATVASIQPGLIRPVGQILQFPPAAPAVVPPLDSWYTIKENPVLMKNEVISY